MGRGGVGGVAAGGATEVGEAEEGGLGAVLLGGKTVGAFVRSTLGTAAVGALATYLYHTQAAPRINKAIGATAGRSVNDVAQGAIIGATLGNILPGFGTVVGGALGAGVGLVASLNRPLPQNTYQKALVAYAKAHPLANPELARAFVGVNGRELRPDGRFGRHVLQLHRERHGDQFDRRLRRGATVAVRSLFGGQEILRHGRQPEDGVGRPENGGPEHRTRAPHT